MMRYFIVLYRYKTRPLYRKGKWKADEKCFAASDLAEALRLAKEYAEKHFRSQWVVDVCSERIEKDCKHAAKESAQ